MNAFAFHGSFCGVQGAMLGGVNGTGPVGVQGATLPKGGAAPGVGTFCQDVVGVVGIMGIVGNTKTICVESLYLKYPISLFHARWTPLGPMS